jgi:hypothetical protein
MHGHPGVAVTNHGHKASETGDAFGPAQPGKCSPILSDRQLELGAGCMEIGVIMFGMQHLKESVEVFLPRRIILLRARCSAK